jgi:hypothetical protein
MAPRLKPMPISILSYAKNQERLRLKNTKIKRISLVIVAGIRQLLSKKNPNNTKASGEKKIVFLHLLHFRDFLDSPILQ